jgi:hypothetical protein
MIMILMEIKLNLHQKAISFMKKVDKVNSKIEKQMEIKSNMKNILGKMSSREAEKRSEIIPQIDSSKNQDFDHEVSGESNQFQSNDPILLLRSQSN